MKNIAKAALLAASLFVAANVNAQVVKKVERTTVKVGHKTSEIASKGASYVVDKRYSGHYGPYGETVYIDKHSRYYYVNKRGHHVYVTKAHLRTRKPM